MELAIERMSVKQLVPYARNSRTHSEDQLAQIAASIREFGFTNPVLIDADNGIIAGHGRVLAAGRLGMVEVPCIRLGHLSEAQKRAYVIADNKIALNASWDEQMLALEMVDLQSSEFEIALTGFTGDELAAFMRGQFADGQSEADKIPLPPVSPSSARGDLWQCWRHRILCGDCRDPDDVRRLASGRLINLAFTSPPYAEQRHYDVASGFEPIKADRYVEWFAPVAANVKRHLVADGSWFVNIKPAADGLDTELYVFDLVLAHVRQWGWHFATEFCWERLGVPKQVVRRFKNQFEPIYQFTRGDWKMRPGSVRHNSDKVPKARGKGAGHTSWAEHQGGGMSSVGVTANAGRSYADFRWFGDRIEEGLAYPGNRLPSLQSTHNATGHTAAFPVGLPDFFVKAYTDADDVVFDPFMGSGSTLIASDINDRVGLGMELSPIYCDVIVKRWQAFTSKQATLEGDGRTFDEVAEERAKQAA